MADSKSDCDSDYESDNDSDSDSDKVWYNKCIFAKFNQKKYEALTTSESNRNWAN